MERKAKTLIQHPDRVVKKYVRKLWYRFLFMGKVRPLGCENYDKHWNYLSFKDKTILDLGADYGSTADYFLRHGVASVIAVEGDYDYAAKFHRLLGNDQRIKYLRFWIDNPQDITFLICQYKPDIVKVDIEGNEKLLSDVDVSQVKEWLIETHTVQLHQVVRSLFLQSGFRVSTVDYGKTENAPEIKVLIATRK